MSAEPSAEPPEAAAAPLKSKKSKKKKNKSAAGQANGNEARRNGGQDQGAAEEESEKQETTGDEASSEQQDLGTLPQPSKSTDLQDTPNGTSSTAHHTDETTERPAEAPADVSASSDPESRLEAAARERDKLRDEVVELRKSLEELQQRHMDETASLKSQLDESQSSREHAEGQYQKLLGKVNTIRSQLGERLKADAEELSQARERIDELQLQSKTMAESNDNFQQQISSLNSEKEQQGREISELRGRTNVSQQNWAKERDDLIRREAQTREEFEAAKQAMQDWEVLAMEERSVREGLSDRVAELEEQLSSQRDAYEKATSERDSQSATVDGLQRALQDIQEARKQELREVVENSQAQIEVLRTQLKASEDTASSSQAALKSAQEELERALPFEKEVKEKNLLIGKLRHEAVILNDHLTKALRFLKKGRPEDNVDRQLVTNHFLHFLALDRADPKKFQVLQLISALLGWTEEQKEAAGLARPGASTQTTTPSSSLRIPLAPFRRVSSTASLNTSVNPSQPLNTLFSPSAASPPIGPMSPASKESMAELWNGFLDQEGQEGEPSGSRRTSVSTMISPLNTKREGFASTPPLHSPSPPSSYAKHKHGSSRSVSFTQGPS